MTIRAKYLVGTLVQSSADALVNKTVTTGIMHDAAQGIAIKRVELELDATLLSTWTITPAPAWLRICVVHGNQTALLNLDDSSVICNFSDVWGGIAYSATGTVIAQRRAYFVWEAPPSLEWLVVHDTITIIVDSTGTGVANRLNYRITYRKTNLTMVEKVQAFLS